MRTNEMHTSQMPASPGTAPTMGLIACAPDSDSVARDITARGSLPLLIGDSVLAELSRDELTQGIEAAAELTPADLARLSGDLARQLRNALEAGGDTADLSEMAGNAAALFVLCLKQNGIDAQSDICACTVSYNTASNVVLFERTG